MRMNGTHADLPGTTETIAILNDAFNYYINLQA